jgi:hypothetical protein
MADNDQEDVERDPANEAKFPAGGQVSEGPSGLGGDETSGGGADAVPDTPDTVPGTPN